MVESNTGRIVTLMKYFKTFWYFSVSPFPNKPMSIDLFVIDPDFPITRTITGTFPNPTVIGFIYL